MESRWLLVGGVLSSAAAALHLAVIAGGPAWYRFFGAGERMAHAAERGSLYATLITLGIATILALWAAYAFSGAGLIARLPLTRTGLVAISAIYLARGLLFVPSLLLARGSVSGFAIWSSAVVLALGCAYGVGTWLSWSCLS